MEADGVNPELGRIAFPDLGANGAAGYTSICPRATIDVNGDRSAPALGRMAAQMNRAKEPGQWSKGIVEPAHVKAISRNGLTQALLYFQAGTNDNRLADELEFRYDPSDGANGPRLTVYLDSR